MDSWLFSLNSIFVIFSAFISSTLYSETLTLSEVIDKAGQQRMLSQRMAKAYLLQNVSESREKGQIKLADAIRQFKDNFTHIERHHSARNLRDELGLVQKHWLLFEEFLKKPYTPEHGAALLKQSDQLLSAAHHYVIKLQFITGEAISEVVGTSGRQRMLSQRIARNYLAYHLKLSGNEWLDRVYDDLAEYENTLLYLKTFKQNTHRINTMLRKAHSNFRFINQGFDGILSLSPDRLVHVAVSSTEMMLYRMDGITKRYAALETHQNTSLASR